MTMPERLPRPGEDSVDWAYSVGELPESTYRIARPQGKATRSVMAAARAREKFGDLEARSVTASSTPQKSQTTAAPGGRVAAATARDLTGMYALNPLVAQVQTSSRVYASAAQASGGQTPTLFQGGDLPLFTASGVDPKLLRQIPWTARHAVASEPDRTKVLDMFEQLSGPDALAMASEYESHQGNKDYANRVMAWQQAGFDLARQQDEQRAAEVASAQQAQVMAAIGDPDEWTDEQSYDYLFGDLDRRSAAQAHERDLSILEGRTIGHAEDLAQVRARVEARVAASGGQLPAVRR